MTNIGKTHKKSADSTCYVTNCEMTGGAAGYIWSSSRQPWELHNLTVYVTHYYHTVIHAANMTGFRMSHVRVRAWAFLGGGIGKKMAVFSFAWPLCLSFVPSLSWQIVDRNDKKLKNEGGVTSLSGSMAGLSDADMAAQSWLTKRVFNYSYSSPRGDLLMIENCTDFQVVDNDLVATWTAVEIHNSDHGVVARNELWPGTHGCHGLIDIFAVTFEHNRCVGAVQGSRLYLKYAYHLYQAWNTELVTWGGAPPAIILVYLD